VFFLIVSVRAIRFLVVAPAVDVVEDARWAEDYRHAPSPAAADSRSSGGVPAQMIDWEFLDVPGRPQTVVATAHNAIQVHRRNGGPFDVWRTYDVQRTGGALTDDGFRDVDFDGQRLSFVGMSGRLASSSANFGDWKVHRGGGGGAPNASLAEAELTDVLAVPSEGFFAIGTERRGPLLYDVTTRQFVPLLAHFPSFQAARVTSLLFDKPHLWIGTDRAWASSN
jgi:hypothetical protein